jgi:hypothetical protein
MVPRRNMEFPEDPNPFTGVTKMLPYLCAAFAVTVVALAVKKRKHTK